MQVESIIEKTIKIMKYIIIISVIIIFINCNQQDEVSEKNQKYFNQILKSLEKNYTQDKINDNLLFCLNLSRETFVRDSIEYVNNLKVFQTQKKLFLYYLINYKTDDNKFCKWIYTKNPCSSVVKDGDIISNTKGVIILIDNMLVNNNEKIIINDYIKKISISDLRKIIIQDSSLNFEEIKKNYIKYIEDSGNVKE